MNENLTFFYLKTNKINLDNLKKNFNDKIFTLNTKLINFDLINEKNLLFFNLKTKILT